MIVHSNGFLKKWGKILYGQNIMSLTKKKMKHTVSKILISEF